MVIKYRRDVLCLWAKAREGITCTYPVIHFTGIGFILCKGEVYEMDAFLTLQIK